MRHGFDDMSKLLNHPFTIGFPQSLGAGHFRLQAFYERASFATILSSMRPQVVATGTGRFPLGIAGGVNCDTASVNSRNAASPAHEEQIDDGPLLGHRHRDIVVLRNSPKCNQVKCGGIDSPRSSFDRCRPHPEATSPCSPKRKTGARGIAGATPSSRHRHRSAGGLQETRRQRSIVAAAAK